MHGYGKERAKLKIKKNLHSQIYARDISEISDYLVRSFVLYHEQVYKFSFEKYETLEDKSKHVRHSEMITVN